MEISTILYIGVSVLVIICSIINRQAAYRDIQEALASRDTMINTMSSSYCDNMERIQATLAESEIVTQEAKHLAENCQISADSCKELMKKFFEPGQDIKISLDNGQEIEVGAAIMGLRQKTATKLEKAVLARLEKLEAEVWTLAKATPSQLKTLASQISRVEDKLTGHTPLVLAVASGESIDVGERMRTHGNLIHEQDKEIIQLKKLVEGATQVGEGNYERTTRVFETIAAVRREIADAGKVQDGSRQKAMEFLKNKIEEGLQDSNQHVYRLENMKEDPSLSRQITVNRDVINDILRKEGPLDMCSSAIQEILNDIKSVQLQVQEHAEAIAQLAIKIHRPAFEDITLRRKNRKDIKVGESIEALRFINGTLMKKVNHIITATSRHETYMPVKFSEDEKKLLDLGSNEM